METCGSCRIVIETLIFVTADPGDKQEQNAKKMYRSESNHETLAKLKDSSNFSVISVEADPEDKQEQNTKQCTVVKVKQPP